MNKFSLLFARISLKNKILSPSLITFCFLVIIVLVIFYGFQLISAFTTEIITKSAESIKDETQLSHLIQQTQQESEYYFLSRESNHRENVENSITDLKKLPSITESEVVEEALLQLEEVITATSVRFELLSKQRKSALELVNKIRLSISSLPEDKKTELLQHIDRVMADIYFPNKENTNGIEKSFKNVTEGVETESLFMIEDLWDLWAGYIAVHTKLLADADSRLQSTLEILHNFQLEHAQARQLKFDNLKKQALKKLESIRYFIILLAIIGVLISILIALRVAASISNPILKCVSMADTIAQGDVREKLNLFKYDEIGELGRSMDKMIDSLRQRSDLAKSISSGDLTHDVVLFSEYDLLGDSLKMMLEKLSEIILQIQRNSIELSQSSSELAAIVSQLASGAAEMVNYAGSVASSSTLMSEHVNETKGTADKMMNDVNSAVESLGQMSNSVKEVGALSHTGADVAKEALELSGLAVDSMKKLNTGTNKIGEIVEVINEITDQTKLLALNATIEAARAGEAGRGFSVVAQEVKELAQQSSKAAANITEQIADVQANSNEAMHAMTNVSEVVNKAHRASLDISSSVETQTAVSREINDNMMQSHSNLSHFIQSIETLSASVNEVSENILQIDQQIKSLNTGLESINSESLDLSSLASSLENLVEKFKISSQKQNASGTTA